MPLYMYQRRRNSLSNSWNLEQEQILRSKVHANVAQLCKHKLTEVFRLFSIHGRRLLISHPDLIFMRNSRILPMSSTFQFINSVRNIKIISWLWRATPLGLRIYLYPKILKTISEISYISGIFTKKTSVTNLNIIIKQKLISKFYKNSKNITSIRNFRLARWVWKKTPDKFRRVIYLLIVRP